MLFADEVEYERKTDKTCTPYDLMSSTNVNDAKKECTANPKCHMFIDYLGDGRSFGACENTALIKDSTIIGSALYQKSYGNKISTFEYLSDKL